jgi:hypothetical protein
LNPLNSTTHPLDGAQFPESVILTDFARRYRRAAWNFGLTAGSFGAAPMRSRSPTRWPSTTRPELEVLVLDLTDRGLATASYPTGSVTTVAD